MEQQEIKKITIGKYRFESFQEEREGKMFYFAKKYRLTPKGKYRPEVCEYFYRYSNQLDREAKIVKDIEYIKMGEQKEQERKNARAEMKRNFTNPFKVGQLFYDSWGYEQTNIDFFQVVEVGKMSVMLRPIGQELVRTSGWMSEWVRPAVGKFTGEPFRRIIQISKYSGSVYLNGFRGSIEPIGEKEEFNQTHYA